MKNNGVVRGPESWGQVWQQRREIFMEEITRQQDERHSQQVSLIGVTASGGMIDFPLKFTDPDKARGYLQSPANLSMLFLADSGTVIMHPESLDEDIQWEEDGILFTFFLNSDSVIQPGTEVISQFGSLYHEPMLAQ